MRRWLRPIGYGLAGILFAVALTLAAYAVAGGGAAEPAIPVDLAGDLAPDEASASPSPTPASSPSLDISGPCDEAEHVGDPRCAGGVEVEDEDEDRSGSNSGSED